MITSNRTNTFLLVLILAVGLGVAAMLATGARGGPLDPPLPPGATDSVREPGTPITSLPLTINQPGRYYLTRNLTAPAGNPNGGITINAENVTLDLTGFVIFGANLGNGVTVQNLAATIENGTVRNFDIGIFASPAGYATVSHVHAQNNDIGGIRLGAGGRVVDCDAHQNGLGVGAATGFGIWVNDSVVENCNVWDNEGIGIHADSRSVVRSNYVLGSTGDGIFLGGDANLADRNFSCSNVGEDIRIGSVNQAAHSNVLRDNVAGSITGLGSHYVPLIFTDQVLTQQSNDHNNVIPFSSSC